MEKKKSGVGIAAGILYSILLFYEIAVDAMNVIRYPSIYLNIHELFWWLAQIAGDCVSVFLIISLFGDRRSRLLFVSYIINTVLYLCQIAELLRDGSYKVLCSATFLMMTGALILRTVMVVYWCIPALQKDTQWTGKIWFIPPALSGITIFINILQYPKMHWENFAYHPLWMTFQLSLNVISVVSLLLFCLWLTEPVRIRKDKPCL